MRRIVIPAPPPWLTGATCCAYMALGIGTVIGVTFTPRSRSRVMKIGSVSI